MFAYCFQYDNLKKYELLLGNRSFSASSNSFKTERNFESNSNTGNNRLPKREMFYPYYGSGKNRRRTNLYRNGETKGKMKKENKIQRDARWERILSNHNKRN